MNLHEPGTKESASTPMMDHPETTLRTRTLPTSARPTLSVVIPSHRESTRLLECLQALEIVSGIDEIIVASHGESESVEAHGRGQFPQVLWVDCPVACRGDQLNRGARAAHGDILLFLHADTVLPADAASLVRDALRDERVAGGAFRLAFDARHTVFSILSTLSALSWRITFLGDQAMFCRRIVFDRIGGFRNEPLFEDVDLAFALSRHGRIVRLHARVLTSTRRFTATGPFRQLARNAILLALHHAGVSTRVLAPKYANRIVPSGDDAGDTTREQSQSVPIRTRDAIETSRMAAFEESPGTPRRADLVTPATDTESMR